MDNFKEPTSILCDRTKKSKAVKRLKEEGLVFYKVFDKFLDFLNNAPKEKLYEFMKSKKLLILLFIGGAVLGYLLSDYGKEAIQWATTSFEMIDEVMRQE